MYGSIRNGNRSVYSGLEELGQIEQLWPWAETYYPSGPTLKNNSKFFRFLHH